MADYSIIRKSRNTLSSFLHVLMNILLGVGSISVTLISGSWILGIILVLISKWRIFAVRPRYWLLNLKSSLVDLIVGASFVVLAYLSGTEILPIHILLAALYTIWLIFIKPKTKNPYPLIQSLFATFLGSTAALIATTSVDSIVFVLIEFLIGYGASRHLFAQTSEGSFTLVTFACGLLYAELAWLCSTWSIIYSFGSTGSIVPQFSIILTLSAFAFAKAATSVLRHDGEVRYKEVLPPTAFSLILIAVIVFAFSNPIFNV